MSHKPLIFPVYSEPPANIESVIPPLQEIFKGTGIHVTTCTQADLRNGLLQEPHTVGFSLPGIIGENSHYTAQIGETGLKEMAQAVRAGRIMLAICAGAYFIARETVYNPAWGPAKGRKPENHIFKARAYGPLADMGGKYNPDEWPSDLSLAQVWYKTGTAKNGKDHWKHAAFAYGNGPGLDPDYPDSPDLEPLAYYSHIKGRPLAAASLRHGAGKILILGALPHIGYREVAPHPGTERVRKLLTDMKVHEPNRQEFMDFLGERLRQQVLTYRAKFSI